MPLSKAFLKKAATLDDAKGRRRAGLFAAEGTKCVCDLARRFAIRRLLALPEWLDGHGDLGADETTPCTREELRSVTRLTATPPVIAFFALPDEEPAPAGTDGGCVLVLDRIQDPGNLGTILRTCDWMGIRRVVASPDTADCFNPKTVQATMGALAQVSVSYTDLPQWLTSLDGSVPVYGTFLNAADAYAEPFAGECVIIMGNEGRGISPEVGRLVNRPVTIPAAPGACAESLNVATATAIVLALRARCISKI